MTDSSGRLSHFWQELKRRRVVRVVIFYASASFVILELIALFSEPFGLPDRTFKIVFVVLLIGFILAIILSWIFDVTRKGIIKTKPLNLADIISKYEGSIAVLPFQDMSPEKDQEYFCDGMAEEIINALTRIESLKVIARTSAFAFKNENKDMREIGKTLGVETLLEGSIRKDGNQLRITAQLILVEDGSHLWSEAYNRDLNDMFAIQEEISMTIVHKLKIKILGDEKKALRKRYTEDVEAFNLYLKGLYYWQQMTPEGNQKAVEYYEKSILKDPKFALAYAVLGSNLIFASQNGFIPPMWAIPKSKEYTQKALEIDDTISVVHSNLAIISMFLEWNWEAGEKALKKALSLNPSSGWDHYFYSGFLLTTYRFEEAIAEAKQALELDPFNVYLNTMMGRTYLIAGQCENALEKLEWAANMYPSVFLVHQNLGEVYQVKSMMVEAKEAYEKAVQFSGGVPSAVSRLACALYKTGEKEEAEKKMKNLEQRMENEYVPPTCFIPYYVLKGDHDETFSCLEKACNERDFNLPSYLQHPIEEYRVPDEPRFKALLKQVGLEKYQH